MTSNASMEKLVDIRRERRGRTRVYGHDEEHVCCLANFVCNGRRWCIGRDGYTCTHAALVDFAYEGDRIGCMDKGQLE
jgi:hypothetical protein